LFNCWLIISSSSSQWLTINGLVWHWPFVIWFITVIRISSILFCSATRLNLTLLNCLLFFLTRSRLIFWLCPFWLGRFDSFNRATFEIQLFQGGSWVLILYLNDILHLILFSLGLKRVYLSFLCNKFSFVFLFWRHSNWLLRWQLQFTQEDGIVSWLGLKSQFLLFILLIYLSFE
jgi:hypothetical protein